MPSFSILRIRNSGFLHRYLKYTKPKKLNCYSELAVKPSYQDELGLSDVSHAFLVLILISLISILIALVEYGVNSWFKTNQGKYETRQVKTLI